MAKTNGGVGGRGDSMIRVDMTAQRATVEPFPDAWTFLGGRALTARILLEDGDPQCDPLAPGNLLIFAPGVLAGTAAPTSGRISVGAKSPLTGGIKEANAGGNPGQHLTKLGYRAIVVSGAPADADEGLRPSLRGRAEALGLPAGQDDRLHRPA